MVLMLLLYQGIGRVKMRLVGEHIFTWVLNMRFCQCSVFITVLGNTVSITGVQFPELNWNFWKGSLCLQWVG